MGTISTVHAMNAGRREAFDMMRRQSLRAASRACASSAPLWATYFRDEVMGASMADALEDLGWLTVLPGRRGRPSQIHLTEIGMWVLGGAT